MEKMGQIHMGFLRFPFGKRAPNVNLRDREQIQGGCHAGHDAAQTVADQ
jgi:hypothetical protein